MKRDVRLDSGSASGEDARLAALRQYQILDTSTEALFTDFVEIAADICAAPIALVSFVDAKRQWFAAEFGLGARETPIEQSVCAHAIRTSGIFVVPDLAADPRFSSNPLVHLSSKGALLRGRAAGDGFGAEAGNDLRARPSSPP